MRRRGGGDEAGTVLIIVMIGVTVASIGLAVATQAWSTTWRRDSEAELIFRANQYVTAIAAYHKEHGMQFPLQLEELYKPGPRRLRYIRKLYTDPIARDGKWGLLYLMPGGQGIFDPKNPQGQGITGVDRRGVTDTGSGVPDYGGGNPGAPPPGLPPGMMPPGTGAQGGMNASLVSEPPMGWPIVGVISRATGQDARNTFKIYKGHESVNEWQFSFFDRMPQQPQLPGGMTGQTPGPRGVGPGYGGKPAFGLGGGPLGGGRGANPWDRMQRPNWNQGGGKQQQGGQGNQSGGNP